jgi:motility quorum-sensing regulator/GCU-specific mRNA interferase toxin
MEKRKPTYDLESFKAALSAPEKLYATGSAIRDARSLGFSRADMVEAIQEMERHHFHKSMTSYADHTTWQDVYHVPFCDLLLYIKFTADRVTEFRLLSFKEK